MAANLGTKYTCGACQCKFYDLNKPEPVCPRCGANQKEQPSPIKTAPRARAQARARVEYDEPDAPRDEEQELEADLGDTSLDIDGEVVEDDEED